MTKVSVVFLLLFGLCSSTDVFGQRIVVRRAGSVEQEDRNARVHVPDASRIGITLGLTEALIAGDLRIQVESTFLQKFSVFGSFGAVNHSLAFFGRGLYSETFHPSEPWDFSPWGYSYGFGAKAYLFGEAMRDNCPYIEIGYVRRNYAISELTDFNTPNHESVFQQGDTRFALGYSFNNKHGLLTEVQLFAANRSYSGEHETLVEDPNTGNFYSEIQPIESSQWVFGLGIRFGGLIRVR